jgi:hypothetical protein
MFFRGTAAGQDYRFEDKQAKQLKAIDASAPPEYAVKVRLVALFPLPSATLRPSAYLS